MGSVDENLRRLIAYLQAVRAAGGVEFGQLDAAVKAVKDLDHALRVGDLRRAKRLAGTIAKLFLMACGDPERPKRPRVGP